MSVPDCLSLSLLLRRLTLCQAVRQSETHRQRQRQGQGQGQRHRAADAVSLSGSQDTGQGHRTATDDTEQRLLLTACLSLSLTA